MHDFEYGAKRIGIFLGVTPSDGGMFQYAQSLLEALMGIRGTDSEVVVVYVSRDWEPVLENLGINGQYLRNSNFGIAIANFFMVMRIPCRLTRILGQFINPLIRELKSFQCGLWIFPAQDSLSWQVSGVRLVGTIHDLMHRYESRFPEAGSAIRYRVREHRFSNIAKNCDVILADSSVGRMQIVESYGINPQKIYTLPYVAPSRLKNATENSNLLYKYDLPNKYLFYPAQFWKHKNHHGLIEAIKILSDKHPDIFLVLSGGLNNIYKDIYRYASLKGVKDKIKFLGYVPPDDLRELYRHSRALVYPTFFGPTNIPPLEAFSLGCPVVVSNIYAMPEQCGDAALYFDPLNVKEIANVISQVWVDDELILKMIKRGYALAENCNQSNFNKKFKEILRQSNSHIN